MAVVDGGPVRPHVQAFADEIATRFGVRSSTYAGHQPARDLALDIWGSRDARDRVVEFYRREWRRFNGDYIIDQQRIWNPEVSDSWRKMADRGNDTANHFDHVHVSFQAVGPRPTQQEEDDMYGDNDRARDNSGHNALERLEAAVRDSQHGLVIKVDETKKLADDAMRLGVHNKVALDRVNEKLDRLIAKSGA